MVSQYDVEVMLRLEAVIGRSLELYATDEEEIALLRERVEEAGRHAANQLREEAKMKGTSRKRRQIGNKADDEDREDVVEAGMSTSSFKKKRRS
jgi:ATP-dependent RNA helicase DDX47/RRP3